MKSFAPIGAAGHATEPPCGAGRLENDARFGSGEVYYCGNGLG